MRPRHLILIFSSLVLVSSAYLAFQREGLLPWIGLILGVGSLSIAYLWQRPVGLIVAGVALTLVPISWAASIYYVYSTWESGEVIDISLTEDTVIRTLVVESESQEVVIYDCPPTHQALLDNLSSVTIKKDAIEYSAAIRAVPITMDSPELIDVYELYEAKYPHQGSATEVYYALIGPRRGSQLYLLYLSPQARP